MAALGFAVSLTIAFAIAAGLSAVGIVRGPLLVAGLLSVVLFPLLTLLRTTESAGTRDRADNAR